MVGAAAKGIHIRQALPVPKEYTVTVEPSFMNDKNVCKYIHDISQNAPHYKPYAFVYQISAPKKKIEFNVRCTMVPSEPWVKVASFLDLSYGSRSFVVCVDPSGLPVGVHTAR